MKSEFNALELPIWQNPQSSVAIRYLKNSVYIYFSFWNSETYETDTNYIGEIEFENAWALELEVLPMHGIMTIFHNFKSYILQADRSGWLLSKFELRQAVYPDWLNWDKKKYYHYIVQGSESWIQVLASNYSVKIQPISSFPDLAYLCEL